MNSHLQKSKTLRKNIIVGPNSFGQKRSGELMINLIKTFFFICLILLSFQAIADEPQIDSLELPLADITLKPGTTLKLKSLALKINPQIDINNIQLLAIEILAKSQQGKGMLRLRIGNKLSDWQKISGDKQTFNSKQNDSFHTTKVRSPDAGKGKAWQLLINGYIKIRKVTLYTANTQSLPEGSV